MKEAILVLTLLCSQYYCKALSLQEDINAERGSHKVLGSKSPREHPGKAGVVIEKLEQVATNDINQPYDSELIHTTTASSSDPFNHLVDLSTDTSEPIKVVVSVSKNTF